MKKLLSLFIFIVAFIVLSAKKEFYVWIGIVLFSSFMIYLAYKSGKNEKICNIFTDFVLLGSWL